jgi:hypothetical protein
MDELLRLDVGGGRNPEPGYTVLDIEAKDGVDIVAPAWATGLGDESVAEIRARHFFEHLTLNEARRTLREWRRILVVGGTATITVPDIEYHAEQLTMPGQSEFVAGRSNFEHALAGFYGWQGLGETMGHKYGYTRGTLLKLIRRHGFECELLGSRACDVAVIARKP